jgi:hypothetical protein
VTAANHAFYAAESALDVPSMEKVWAHEEYVALASPRAMAPLIGWTALQSYFARNFGFLPSSTATSLAASDAT